MSNKRFNIFFLLIIVSISVAGQSDKDSLWMEGSKIFQKGYEIDAGVAQDMMKTNPAAFTKMKQARSNKTIANVLGFTGGVLIGIPVGQLVGGNDDPNWTLAAVGGGLILAGIPLAISYKNHARKAVSIYNNKNLKSSFWKLEMNQKGIGLAFQF